MKMRTYIAIDLKSFYASVECVERGLDPLRTNLVVADVSRTEKTICLAATPAIKAYGISGRARLFEVVQRIRQVNAIRLNKAPGHAFSGSSIDADELKQNPALAVDYIAAPPQMERYMECSAGIYRIYLKYIAPEDIHVYSVDEVFIDATDYLKTYNITARELAVKMIRDVHQSTGITATAGIGTNLYLCKIAMDIVAKRMPADSDGVRIAELDEMTYRELLWTHEPLTDFWRIGRGYAKKLAANGIKTMGDIARCSIYNEELLYRLFGINAELLIDHAWGWEPCTVKDIKNYRTASKSLSTGQVLPCPYSFEKGRLIAKEMTDLLVLDLVDKELLTDQIVLTVCYDTSCLTEKTAAEAAQEEITTDFYGRSVPKQAHGSINLGSYTASSRQICNATIALYNQIVNRKLLVRRVYVVANHIISENEAPETAAQMSLFAQESEQFQIHEKERKMQKAVLSIQKKYGKNAILKGMNFQEGATTRERNAQIGGHKK